MSETVTIWRCRECGKWSHAKRDPIAHGRYVDTLDDDGCKVGRHTVWCGPFDRLTAQLDDTKPQRPTVAARRDPNG